MAELVWLHAAMRLQLLVSVHVLPHARRGLQPLCWELEKIRNLLSCQICWWRAESEAGSWAARQAALLCSQKSKKAFQSSCSGSSSLPSILAWSAKIWALRSTSAMPPSFPARKQVALPGKSAAALPVTGLFAATKVWMALQSRSSSSRGTGTKVAW